MQPERVQVLEKGQERLVLSRSAAKQLSLHVEWMAVDQHSNDLSVAEQGNKYMPGPTWFRGWWVSGGCQYG